MTKKVEVKVSENLSKDVKDFKKKVKHFRKVSKRDFKEGINLANELIADIDKLMKKDNKALAKVVERGEVVKIRDSLELYISNVQNILDFQKKYNEKEGVDK
jgi:hypothetical protein